MYHPLLLRAKADSADDGICEERRVIYSQALADSIIS
jgi:hypothetical protein